MTVNAQIAIDPLRHARLTPAISAVMGALVAAPRRRRTLSPVGP